MSSTLPVMQKAPAAEFRPHLKGSDVLIRALENEGEQHIFAEVFVSARMREVQCGRTSTAWTVPGGTRSFPGPPLHKHETESKVRRALCL
jgi:hypothetical protein